MIDEHNAAGAPAGDTAPALTLDDAVAKLDAADERRERAEARAERAASDGPAEDGEPIDNWHASGHSASDAPSEDEVDQGAEPKGDDDSDAIVPGKARTRLRDGTVVAVGDLKKAFDELQDYKRQATAMGAERAELVASTAKLREQQHALSEVLPQALSVLQSALPPEPDPGLRDRDPLRYLTEKDRRDRAISEMQRLDGVRRQAEASREQAAVEAFQILAVTERARLTAARPELKDPVKAKAFLDEFQKIGETFGYSPAELADTHDHRLILGVMSLAEKAARWDRLQADMPKAVDKARDAAPVQAPGRRVASSERRGAEADELSQRLSRSGSLDDAAALLDKLNL